MGNPDFGSMVLFSNYTFVSLPSAHYKPYFPIFLLWVHKALAYPLTLSTYLGQLGNVGPKVDAVKRRLKAYHGHKQETKEKDNKMQKMARTLNKAHG